MKAHRMEKAVPRSGRPWRRWLVFVAKLCVATGLLGWLFGSGRLDFSVLLHARSYWLLAAAGLVLLASLLVVVWRWLWLIRIQGLSVPTMTAIRFTWLGLFANMFLPGAAGGDLAKAYVACRHQPSAKTRAVSTVFIDRVFGLHSILFISSVAGVCILSTGCGPRQASVAWFGLACFTVASAALVLLLWKPSSGLVLRLLPGRFRVAVADSLGRYRRAWGRLLAVWLYSGLCSVLAILSYVCVAAALGTRPTVAQALALPLIITAMCLPISPGGLGVGEAAASQLFAEFGMANGGLIVLIVRLNTMLFSIPGAATLLGQARNTGRPVGEGDDC